MLEEKSWGKVFSRFTRIKIPGVMLGKELMISGVSVELLNTGWGGGI
ncbi:MAG: hypothetical protein AB9882_12145 [Ignavibacteriaceae bacterium]